MKEVEFLGKAIELSIDNVRKGGGPFGAVIVKNGRLISSGFNQVVELNDPTAHAEIMAIRKASQVLNTFDLSGCEIFSSCEPCPMCLSAIYWARLDKVYFAASQEDAARFGFDDLYIADELKKDRDRRLMPLVHMPVTSAIQAFQLWKDKLDKKPY